MSLADTLGMNLISSILEDPQLGVGIIQAALQTSDDETGEINELLTVYEQVLKPEERKIVGKHIGNSFGNNKRALSQVLLRIPWKYFGSLQRFAPTSNAYLISMGTKSFGYEQISMGQQAGIPLSRSSFTPSFKQLANGGSSDEGPSRGVGLQSNDEPCTYYNNIPIPEFERLTASVGLDTCVDLDVIWKYIEKASSLLEVGAGYGRSLEGLFQRGYEGEVLAIERTLQFVRHLQAKFGDTIQLYEADARNFAIKKPVDLVLLLWGGIADFSPQEQSALIQRFKEFLNGEGYLIIDSPQIGEVLNPTLALGQHIFMESPYGDAWAYIPSLTEMERYAAELGFSDFFSLPYLTTTGRKRIFYIFRK